MTPRPARATAAAVLFLIAGLAGSCSGGTPGHRASPQTGGPTTPTTGGASTTETTAPTSTTGGGTPSTTAACSDQSVIGSWPLARKAEQLLVVPLLNGDGASVRTAVAEQAGGLLLLGSVPPGPQLVAALQPALTGPVPRPFVMADQEGGGVQRLGADVQSMPWPREMAATMSPAQVQQLTESVARQMAALGVGVDLAPVLDLDAGPALSASDPDGPRSFSTDPSVVARYGQAYAAGLQAGGVLAVAKHFPGLGSATGNTDYEPASTRPIGELEAAGLKPFESTLADGVRAVMVANAAVPGLTSKPASLAAPVITGLLRNDMHFAGLVMTDSLSAGAVRAAGYDVPSASVAAIEAGADMVLFGSTLTPADAAGLAPNPLAAQIQAIVNAVSKAVSAGALPESRLDEAVLHVVQAKGVDLCAAGHG